jgi:Putative prokaryotic signal transducing protein
MRRLTQAPNLALASLWRDMLAQAGFAVSVQRAYASSIAGEIPPDQALPEIWVEDDAQLEAARALLAQLQHPAWRHWVCRGCGERIDGPFDQCWACGAAMPA